MIHGIINNVINRNASCIDLQIYDLIKAFNVADAMNDLWDTLSPGVRDDRLGLLYESSKTNLLAGNTALGQTKRVSIQEIAHRGAGTTIIIAVSLREAQLKNGMLGSIDLWYGIREKEIQQIEDVDKALIRKILDAPSISCLKSLYLELGLIPIRTIIKSRMGCRVELNFRFEFRAFGCDLSSQK